MSDDLVRIEASAVRALKRGLERYVEQIRDALGQARREMAAADGKAQEAVEHRRSHVRQCEQDLRRAEAAVRQCDENCEGLKRQVAAAAQRLAAAQQSLASARRAAVLTANAESELLKILQSTDATVSEHSSVASSALASLEATLASLPKSGPGHAFYNLAVSTAVGVEIWGATMSLGRVTGNALQAVNIDIPLRDYSIAEMVEHRKEQEREYVLEQAFETRKRESSSEVQENK